MSSCESFGSDFISTYWVYICAMISVDMFGILSGYLGIQRDETSTYRIIELVFITLLYSIIITCSFRLFAPEKVRGTHTIIKGLFPELVGGYWYITCFIPIMLLQPCLNKMLRVLSIKEYKIFCLFLCGIIACIPSVFRVNFFGVDGYSVTWLLVCYIIGGYIKRSNFCFFKKNAYNLLCFLGLSVVLLVGNILLYMLSGNRWDYMVSYFSPVIIFMSICIFFFFRDVNISVNWNILSKTAAVTFDVYIIHAHIFVYNYVLAGNFEFINKLPTILVIPAIIGIAIVLFLILTIVGRIRILLFKLFGVEKVIRSLSKRIDELVYDRFLS